MLFSRVLFVASCVSDFRLLGATNILLPRLERSAKYQGDNPTRYLANPETPAEPRSKPPAPDHILLIYCQPVESKIKSGAQKFLVYRPDSHHRDRWGSRHNASRESGRLGHR